MTSAQIITKRLLEDEDLESGMPEQAAEQPSEQLPEQTGQASKQEIRTARDLFVRLSNKPEPFQAKGRNNGDGLILYRQMLQDTHGRPSKKIDNHTYLIKHEDGSIAVKLHKTEIVVCYPDGKVTYSTGGWPTKVTRDRMMRNLVCGWQIYTESFKKHGEEAPELYTGWTNGYGEDQPIRGGISKMFWYNRSTNAGTWESGWYIPFTDGDSIMPDGTLKMQGEPKVRKRTNRAVTNMFP